MDIGEKIREFEVRPELEPLRREPTEAPAEPAKRERRAPVKEPVPV